MKKMIFSAALVVAAMCFSTSANAQDVKVKGQVATEKKECCKAKAPQQVDATTAATKTETKECHKEKATAQAKKCDGCKKEGGCKKAAAEKKDCCKDKANKQ